MGIDDKLREHYRLGREAFQAGRYKEAKEHLLKFIEEIDSFADVYNMLGVISQLEGDVEKARWYLEKALSINPRYVEAALNLAIVYSDMGMYEEAHEAYMKARVGSRVKKGDRRIKDNLIKAKLANLHAQIGDLHAGLGLYEDAAAEYKKALILQPDFADIRNKLGLAYKEIGRFDDAIAQFKKAIEINPRYEQAYLNLSMVYYARGQREEAKKLLRELILEFPENKLASLYYKTLFENEQNQNDNR